MAEFTQDELEQAKPIKRQVSENAVTRKEYSDPLNVSYEGDRTTQLYQEISKGIGAGGRIAAQINKGYEIAVGKKLKDLMDKDHLDMMVNITEQLEQTEIEHLNFPRMLDNYMMRQDVPFMLGKNDASGAPSFQIKDVPLEDYDIPTSQKADLEAHYKGLKKKTLEYLLENIPKIQGEKGLFIVSEYMEDGVSKAAKLFANKDSFEGEEDSPLALHGTKESEGGEGQYTIREDGSKNYVNRITGKTGYDTNLTLRADQELDKIITNFDEILFQEIDAGHIGLEQAVGLQRKFTYEILQAQMLADRARSPKESYKKIKKQGYFIERKFDHKEKQGKLRKGLTEKITLPSKYYQEWMTLQDTKEMAKVEAETKKKNQEDIDVAHIRLTNHFTSPEVLEAGNKTHEQIVKAYLESHPDTTELEAEVHASSILKATRLYKDGVNKVAANGIVQRLSGRVIRNRPLFVKTFGIQDGTLLKSKPTAEIRKILKEEADNFFKETLKDVPESEYKTLLEGMKKEIYGGIDKITEGDIQGYLNKIDTDRASDEKLALLEQVSRDAESDEGIQTLTNSDPNHQFSYFKLNDSGTAYIYDTEKLAKSRYMKQFDTIEEFVKYLEPALKKVNATKFQREGGPMTKKQIRAKELALARLPRTGQKILTTYAQQREKSLFESMLAMKPPEIGKESTQVSLARKHNWIEIYQQEIANVLYDGKTEGYPNKTWAELTPEEKATLIPPHEQADFGRITEAFDKLEALFFYTLPGQNSPVELLNEFNKTLDTQLIPNVLTQKASVAVKAMIDERIERLNKSNFATTIANECADKDDYASIQICRSQKYELHGVDPRDKSYKRLTSVVTELREGLVGPKHREIEK